MLVFSIKDASVDDGGHFQANTSPTTFSTRILFTEKKLLGEDGSPIANVILGTDVKSRVHGNKEKGHKA